MGELDYEQIKDVLRATGYVTNGQAYDLAEIVVMLQKDGYEKAMERARQIANGDD